MRSIALALVLAVLPRATLVTACGDKFLVRCIVNTGSASQVVATARILVYDDGSAPLRHLAEVGLPEELASKGHKVYVVHSRDELLDLLTDTRVDLVIVDWHAADLLRADLGPNPLFLCTILQSEAKMLPELRKKYAPLLKVPCSKVTTVTTVQVAIGDALKTGKTL